MSNYKRNVHCHMMNVSASLFERKWREIKFFSIIGVPCFLLLAWQSALADPTLSIATDPTKPKWEFVSKKDQSNTYESFLRLQETKKETFASRGVYAPTRSFALVVFGSPKAKSEDQNPVINGGASAVIKGGTLLAGVAHALIIAGQESQGNAHLVSVVDSYDWVADQVPNPGNGWTAAFLTWFTMDRYDELFADVLNDEGRNNAKHKHMRTVVRDWARNYKNQAKTCTTSLGWNWDTGAHHCEQRGTGGETTKFVYDRDGDGTRY